MTHHALLTGVDLFALAPLALQLEKHYLPASLSLHFSVFFWAVFFLYKLNWSECDFLYANHIPRQLAHAAATLGILRRQAWCHSQPAHHISRIKFAAPAGAIHAHRSEVKPLVTTSQYRLGNWTTSHFLLSIIAKFNCIVRLWRYVKALFRLDHSAANVCRFSFWVLFVQFHFIFFFIVLFLSPLVGSQPDVLGYLEFCCWCY